VPTASPPRYLGVAATPTSDLKTTAGAAVNTTTQVAFAAATLYSSVRLVPLASASANTPAPAVGTAPSLTGWRDAVAVDATNPTTIAAGTWTMDAWLSRSGQLLEADYNATLTFIVYRVPPTGTTGFVEIGRVTTPFAAVTTTAKDFVGSFTTSSATNMAAGDRLLVETYLTAVDGNGTPNAPVAATTFLCHINAASGAGFSRVSALPTYTTQYSRSLADAAPATDAVTRSTIESRALADSAPAADVASRVAVHPRATTDSAPATDGPARVVTFNRPVADTAGASDAPTRVVTFKRSAADMAGATDAPTRVATFPRAISDSAPAADAATRLATFGRQVADSAPASDLLTRRLTLARYVSDTASASDALSRQLTYVRQVADDVGPTGGGGTTVVKKVYNFLFDD
jgi:hypothetical protein